jgi:hypothetical protein
MNNSPPLNVKRFLPHLFYCEHLTWKTPLNRCVDHSYIQSREMEHLGIHQLFLMTTSKIKYII